MDDVVYLNDLFDIYGELLTDKQQLYFKDYYFDNLSYGEIAEKYNIPVVFMTGDKKIETIKKATEYGVEDYITKPFLPLALKEIIHSILS